MHESMEHILDTLAVAVLLGILAQVLAHRFKLPAILPLLLLGMGAGPFGLHLFDPKVLGATLEAFIHLGVAVILFEGGMDLELRQLRQVGRSIRNLLSVGMAVTWVGAAWLAHVLTGVDWPTASLFGAIVTVTGPTVIAPLLRHMIAPSKVRTILLSEGLMIDPIGAVLAYLVLQWIGRAEGGKQLMEMGKDIFVLACVGAVLGYVAGAMARWVARNRHMAGELRNLVILALLLGAYMVAEHQAPQSGILASVVMGLTVSASTIPDVITVKAFKGQLTILIISVLFILLSGQLDLGTIQALGTQGLLVAAGLIFLVRPLSVLVSIPWKSLTWREKTVLGLTAPRGIVAAAVASLAAIQLRELDRVQEAATLEGLVYLTILVTCAWATVMAIFLPRVLGYADDPSRRRIALVGANPLSMALARLFEEKHWQTVVIDSVAEKLLPFKERGIRTVRGDARDAETYEHAGVERDSGVLALTGNDELNLLVAERVRDEFGVEHPVVAAQRPSDDLGRLRMAWVDLLSGREMPVPAWYRRLEDDQARLHTLQLADDRHVRLEALELLRPEATEVHLICGWKQGKPIFEVDPERLAELDELTFLATHAAIQEKLLPLAKREEPDPEAVEEAQLSIPGDAETRPEMP